MKQHLWIGSLVVCAALVALTAVAATAASIPVKTYIGQTDWQRAQQHAYMSQPVHRTGVNSMFESTIGVSSRGIEHALLSGNCGSTIFHADAKFGPGYPHSTAPIVIRNGAFKTSWGYGRVTATKITGTFSKDHTKRCTTKFTLTARSV